MDLLVFFWNLQGSHFISPKVGLGQGFPLELSAVPGSQEHHRGRAGWCPHRKVAGKGTPGLSGECLSKCGYTALESSASVPCTQPPPTALVSESSGNYSPQ